jgi:hypothetical protein
MLLHFKKAVMQVTLRDTGTGKDKEERCLLQGQLLHHHDGHLRGDVRDAPWVPHHSCHPNCRVGVFPVHPHDPPGHQRAAAQVGGLLGLRFTLQALAIDVLCRCF